MSAATVVREYGQVFRDDWSRIDGRTVLQDMYLIAAWMEAPQTYPGDTDARLTLGICAVGGCHWEHHCDHDCEVAS